MFEEVQYTTPDGIELYGRIDAVAQPVATVVIVHGMGEHLGWYDYVTARLNAQGYSVYRFDHRGFGRSEGPRAYFATYQVLVDDIDMVVDRALSDHPEIPCYLLGHSLGGFGAACYGTAFPGKIDGFVLSGALTSDAAGMLAPICASDAADTDYIHDEISEDICSDPSVLEEYAADPLVIRDISVGLMRATGAGVAWLGEHAENFTDPVLLLHGADDAIVLPKDSLDFFDQIASVDKSLRVYAGLRHKIFSEYDKDAVIDDALTWLNTRAEF